MNIDLLISCLVHLHVLLTNFKGLIHDLFHAAARKAQAENS